MTEQDRATAEHITETVFGMADTGLRRQLEQAIAAAIAAARAEGREQAARVCDRRVEKHYWTDAKDEARACAEAIRAVQV